jgi:uncharacterized protein YbjQ (UPF0145 family)
MTDLPSAASSRLSQKLFTSDLSVSEFALLQQLGYRPLGLVVGSSIYHIGFQLAGWNQSQELSVITQAMYRARELAMRRMEEEARLLQADGVVGVRLEISLAQWGEDLAEFLAIGTAVKAPEPFERPFTSDLSGQELWLLHQTGYRPLGLVFGNCVYYVAHQTLGQALRTLGRNVEMVNFSQALYSARELAMSRMEAEAEELGAQGIVGVHLSEKSFGWGSHVIEFLAVGTAVAPLNAKAEAFRPSPVFDLGR